MGRAKFIRPIHIARGKSISLDSDTHSKILHDIDLNTFNNSSSSVLTTSDSSINLEDCETDLPIQNDTSSRNDTKNNV